MPGLIRLFSELDRLGPGNAESLRWALGIAGLGPAGCVLDAGCGTGADVGTLLSAFPGGRVVALDQRSAFVERVKARFPRAEARVGDFLAPPEGPFDLIWSAGAVYEVGITKALSAWRDHLAEGGRVAFSDMRWRGDERPEEVRAYFETEGAMPMGDVPALEAEIEAAGYRILNARWLGAAGWASYYGPLEVELDGFHADSGLADRLWREIALWRTHGVSYGYRVVVCEKAKDAEK